MKKEEEEIEKLLLPSMAGSFGSLLVREKRICVCVCGSSSFLAFSADTCTNYPYNYTMGGILDGVENVNEQNTCINTFLF